jgi:exopolysaccharide biosynthesis polyprenyl glycosylphosphotransferase
MLRQQLDVRVQLQMALDATLFGLALYLAHLLRANWELSVFGGSPEIRPFVNYGWLLLLVSVGGPLLLHSVGFYGRPLVSSRVRTAWLLFKGCAYAIVALTVVIFVVRQGHLVARSVVLLFGPLAFLLLEAKEEVSRGWRRVWSRQTHLRKRLILLGSPEDTQRIESDLKGAQQQEFEVVARLDLNDLPVESLVDRMHESSANGVVIATKHAYLGQVEQAVEVCEREGVEVWLLADFFKTQISRTRVDYLYGRPMLVFRSTPEMSWPALGKQVLDVVGALGLLALGGVPMLLVAAVIRLTSPGPVLFRQQRSGLNGRPFTMLKFRSMTTDAEQRRVELEALNEMSGPVFKVTADPRVTRIGRFLRKWSIDEIPQMLNVLRGEMSLVGPRPLPVDEVARFDDLAHRRRLSVKPGLTCLWQVSGRNDVRDFKEWVRLDLEYIDNWSLWLDIKILARTIPAVLSAAGAK